MGWDLTLSLHRLKKFKASMLCSIGLCSLNSDVFQTMVAGDKHRCHPRSSKNATKRSESGCRRINADADTEYMDVARTKYSGMVRFHTLIFSIAETN
jgi:hypothetical protein